jgi:hypothetical protein
MQTTRPLDVMIRLRPEVAEEDRPRFGEIVDLFAVPPEKVEGARLPEWGRTMYMARRDLREILCHCCRDHHGEALAMELLERFREEDPLD